MLLSFGDNMSGLKNGRPACKNVQLAKVMSGQSRLLTDTQVGRSAASWAAICPIPKLTVRGLTG
jgi:hypothetical protein